MKKRNLVIVAFMLVAAMTIGVGYAVVSDVLVINGTADITADGAQSAFNEDVYFSAAVAGTDGDIAEVGSDPDTATFTASHLTGQGDTATFTFTIKNAGDVNATVTPKLSAEGGNTQPLWFEITSDWNGAAKALNAHSEITYTVTVRLLATPTQALTGLFQIELDAVSVGS